MRDDQITNLQQEQSQTESDIQSMEWRLRGIENDVYGWRDPTASEVESRRKNWEAANPFKTSFDMPDFTHPQIRFLRTDAAAVEQQAAAQALQDRISKLEAKLVTMKTRTLIVTPAPKVSLQEREAAHTYAVQAEIDRQRRNAQGIMVTSANQIGKGDELKKLQAKAEAGDVESQLELSARYSPSDLNNSSEAVRWLRAAANQGNAEAEYYLGARYAEGVGVQKNSVEAEKWYRLAADQGLVRAQNDLGARYSEGEGVPKNKAEAVKYFHLAAEQGDAIAQFNLGRMYGADGDSRDDAKMIKWFQKAAVQGLAEAECALGMIYADGTRVPKDFAQAEKWARKAAEQGDPDAQFGLGVMYNSGDGLKRNGAEAIKWVRKAAVNGNPKAQSYIGVMYENGDGVPKDEVEGLAWFSIAAVSGDQTSIGNRKTAEAGLGPELISAAHRRSLELLQEIDDASLASSN